MELIGGLIVLSSFACEGGPCGRLVRTAEQKYLTRAVSTRVGDHAWALVKAGDPCTVGARVVYLGFEGNIRILGFVERGAIPVAGAAVSRDSHVAVLVGMVIRTGHGSQLGHRGASGGTGGVYGQAPSNE